MGDAFLGTHCGGSVGAPTESSRSRRSRSNAVAARLPPLGAANHQGTSRWHNMLAMLLSQVAHEALPGPTVEVINHPWTLCE